MSVAFIGAGSVVFTRELLVDLFGYADLDGLDIRLHDIDPERLRVALATAEHIRERLGANATISAHLERAAALTGVDAAVNMIQVGGLASTRTDFEVPAALGLRQTIADTQGLGGIFRALRTFGVLRSITADMRRVCPQAWLLNYTNPMAMNMTYVARTAPDIKAVGLCHSVYWTVAGLCELLDVPLAEVEYTAAGVNHQAWLLEWSHQGENLYQRLDDRIAADPELRRRVRVDMYRRLGYYPTETSEHSSEYVPWYLHHDSEIERLRLQPGEYVGISEENVATFLDTRDRLDRGVALELEDDGATEYAPQVIHSLATGERRRIFGNVVNDALIDNLPDGALVEVPCLVDGDGVHPQPVGALPMQCAALNHAYVDVVELTVAAMIDGDPRHVRHAAMLDPNTAATLTVEQIWQACDALTQAHGDLIPPALRTPLAM